MKRILIFALCVLLLASCKAPGENWLIDVIIKKEQ